MTQTLHTRRSSGIYNTSTEWMDIWNAPHQLDSHHTIVSCSSLATGLSDRAGLYTQKAADSMFGRWRWRWRCRVYYLWTMRMMLAPSLALALVLASGLTSSGSISIILTPYPLIIDQLIGWFLNREVAVQSYRIQASIFNIDTLIFIHCRISTKLATLITWWFYYS